MKIKQRLSLLMHKWARRLNDRPYPEDDLYCILRGLGGVPYESTTIQSVIDVSEEDIQNQGIEQIKQHLRHCIADEIAASNDLIQFDRSLHPFEEREIITASLRVLIPKKNGE